MGKYVGGKRKKGQHKAKGRIAAGKKKGTGIFKPVTLSKDLSAICGMTKGTRGAVTKALWAYIKKNKLNSGKIIKPDAALKKVFAGGSMFKMAGAVSKHLK